jgi:transcription elongation factor Elf1
MGWLKGDPEKLAAAKAKLAELKSGELNPKILCPYCQTTGSVHITVKKEKAGISTGKAAMAGLTKGHSLLLTGLAKKENVNHFHCDNCNMNWEA